MFSHEAYCFRNLTKCKKCGEVVEKKELAEHEEEMHTKEKCKHCYLDFDKATLKTHVEACFEKPVLC